MSSADEGSGMEPDDIVERLCEDPSVPPDVRAVSGLLGRSPEQGRWRLYFTADLTEYFEFDEGDVVHHAKLEPSEGALGGSVVWLRRHATVRHTRTVTREAQLEFLVGGVTAAHLGGTLSAALGRRLGRVGGIKSIPPQASVCFSCPTEGGEHTCVPATCTLATSCATTVPTDPGCGRFF